VIPPLDFDLVVDAFFLVGIERPLGIPGASSDDDGERQGAKKGLHDPRVYQDSGFWVPDSA
jgi:hypothetical protein